MMGSGTLYTRSRKAPCFCASYEVTGKGRARTWALSRYHICLHLDLRHPNLQSCENVCCLIHRVWECGDITQKHLNRVSPLICPLKSGPRDPWVAQRFGACLWPRARSWRPGIESHVGLPVHGACFSLCLCLCLSLSV